ncbi:MAG: serine/threonine-protein phosphatase [Ignavibacteria bacterium]|nr:serine/threonine-protein phosphatase [Ignavibacteria bacterium]MBI3766491.1 serine/threonine-protein phosphatase [Ignavibacteriales bacterium]
MPQPHTDAQKEQMLFTTLKDDLGRGDFGRTMRNEFAELKDVMLTEERRERLKNMSRLKRWLALGWWLLKSLIRKLTPARRLLFVLGMFLILFHVESGRGVAVSWRFDFTALGIAVIIFILMLELKDKLVAHEELRAGHAVQEALMPNRSPEVPGWKLWLFTRSANEVGGDLVDFVKLDERKFGIVIGDIAGKGLSAALLTAKLQATLRAIVPDFTLLTTLGVKLNHIYRRDSLRNVFASLVYAELQSDSGVIRVLNAGHFPPIIVRNDGTEVLEKGGPALGILPDATYLEQHAELQNGDMVIMYSDGLTEAQNETGAFFSEERLISLLPRLANRPVEEIGTSLVAEVDRFIGNGKVTDDLSLVIIKRLG